LCQVPAVHVQLEKNALGPSSLAVGKCIVMPLGSAWLVEAYELFPCCMHLYSSAHNLKPEP